MGVSGVKYPKGPADYMQNDGKRIENVGTPTSGTDAATKAYVDAATGAGAGTYSVDTGTANAYAVANPVIASYTAGDKVNFKAIHTNTGASTIAVNGLATKALTKYGAVALSGGEIVANHVYGATYDGTQFQLGEASDSLPAQSAQLKSQFLATDTGTANAYAVALSPVPLALTTGLTVVFTPANANTGSSTLTVGALTAKNLTKYGAVALTGGELVPGVYYEAQYDGTQFQILSEIPNVGASPFWAGTSGGTANAQTLTPTPAIPAYYAGQTFVFKASASNTGATTLNVSGLGTKAVTKQGTTALASGDLLINAVALVVYDGTQFQLLSPVVT